jgi:tRNA-dihydrouridine synthase
MLEQTKLFTELLPFKNIAVMKKHYKAYIRDFPKASDLRNELMEQDNVADIERVITNFLNKNPGL